MKLANVAGRAALIVDAGAVDIGIASRGAFGPGVLDVLENWAGFLDDVSTLDLSAPSPFDDADLGAPVPSPRQVFGIGLNYRSHAAESGMELPTVPATFTKFPACITGPFESVHLSGPTVDWEVEAVVVIGLRCDHVAESDAWDHVAGVTVGQDLSDRTMQFAAGAQFSLGKSYRG